MPCSAHDKKQEFPQYGIPAMYQEDLPKLIFY